MKNLFFSILFCLLIASCSGPSKEHVELTKGMNADLPANFGRSTLEKVEMTSKTEFKWFFKLSETPDADKDKFIKEEKPAMLAGIKNSPELFNLKKDNITFIFEFKNTDGSPFTEFKIKPDEY